MPSLLGAGVLLSPDNCSLRSWGREQGKALPILHTLDPLAPGTIKTSSVVSNQAFPSALNSAFTTVECMSLSFHLFPFPTESLPALEYVSQDLLNGTSVLSLSQPQTLLLVTSQPWPSSHLLPSLRGQNLENKVSNYSLSAYESPFTLDHSNVAPSTTVPKNYFCFLLPAVIFLHCFYLTHHRKTVLRIYPWSRYCFDVLTLPAVFP